MSNFRVTFSTTNAAFSEDRGAEIASILRKIANAVECVGTESDEGPVRDSNGNTVGAWKVGRTGPLNISGH
jgi:hypothetical protein